MCEKVANLTPTKAIRKYCIGCGENAADVKGCSFTDCPLYPFRMGRRPKGSSPLKSIRAHCLGCNGTSMEVKLCPAEECKLWAYRTGHRPRGEEDGEAEQ